MAGTCVFWLKPNQQYLNLVGKKCSCWSLCSKDFIRHWRCLKNPDVFNGEVCPRTLSWHTLGICFPESEVGQPNLFFEVSLPVFLFPSGYLQSLLTKHQWRKSKVSCWYLCLLSVANNKMPQTEQVMEKFVLACVSGPKLKAFVRTVSLLAESQGGKAWPNWLFHQSFFYHLNGFTCSHNRA